MQQYAAALDGSKAPAGNIGATRVRADSVNALIESYYNLVFPTLRASTRKMRRNILERFREKHGEKQVARLEHVHVASIIAAKRDTPHSGNNLRKVLRHLMEHAIALRMTPSILSSASRNLRRTAMAFIPGVRTKSFDTRRVIR
jgi:hypothetical protein